MAVVALGEVFSGEVLRGEVVAKCPCFGIRGKTALRRVSADRCCGVEGVVVLEIGDYRSCDVLVFVLVAEERGCGAVSLVVWDRSSAGLQVQRGPPRRDLGRRYDLDGAQLARSRWYDDGKREKECR